MKYNIENVKEMFKEKDYTLLSKLYKNQNEKLEFICNKHRDLGIQKVTLKSFLTRKNNCKKCFELSIKENWHSSRNFKHITEEEFKEKHFEKYKEKLKNEVGDEYELIDIVKKMENRTYLKVIHKECGTISKIEQNSFFKTKQRCQNKECIRKRISIEKTKTIEQLKKEIYDLVGEEYILCGEYSGTNADMVFKHNVDTCNLDFKMTPHNFLAGQRCPSCTRLNNASKAEKKIISFLDTKIGRKNYRFQKGFDDLKSEKGYKLYYDFYIEKYNLLIEYQGEYHKMLLRNMTQENHQYRKKLDELKRQYAKSNNINLLEIWYWDFDNIENILDKYLNLLDNN